MIYPFCILFQYAAPLLGIKYQIYRLIYLDEEIISSRPVHVEARAKTALPLP